MSVTIHLSPEQEAVLKARAAAEGLSVEQWLLHLAEQAAERPVPASSRFRNLSDLLLASPLHGANLDLERTRDHPRAVEIE